MKISKTSRKGVFATVSKEEIDKDFEDFGKETNYEDDFPTAETQSPMEEYLKFVNKSIDDINSAIQCLVKSSNAAKNVSDDAQRAAKEAVKDLAVILAELQLAATNIKPQE